MTVPADLPATGSAEIEIDGRQVRLSSLEKVLWPSTGFTKRDLISYYARAAPALVPHLAGRPLTLGRFPDGVEGPGFAQTECSGRPPWMATEALRLRSGAVRRYCVVEDVPSLLWVANLGTLELHPFLARGHEPDRPTAAVLDLDPGPGAGLVHCCEAALRLRELLGSIGLAAWAKTSGAAGLHLYLPLDGGADFGRSRELARWIAARLAADHPRLIDAGGGRSARAGRVRIDWRQNHPRQSIAAPYSLRATDVPRVSAPVTWKELERAWRERDPGSLWFSPPQVLDRLARQGDLFGPLLHVRQALPEQTPTR